MKEGRKKLKKKILKISWEILATPVDLVLFTLTTMGELAGGGCSMKGGLRKLDKLVIQGKDRMVRDAIYRARRENWIEKDFKLTKEGKKRIFSFLPQFLPLKHWDGDWYLTLFDIPERLRRKRDILRENLKKLGCGQLQASCWIGAVNYLTNIEEIVKFYKLEPYVILAQTDKVGKETSRELANRIWKLDKLNGDYRKFISEWESNLEQEKFWLIFKYFSILKRDPQLPLELLPDNWQGIKVQQLVKKFFKKSNFSKRGKVLFNL